MGTNRLYQGHALVVDDHPLYCRALADVARALFGPGGVTEAHSAEAALHLISGIDDLRLLLLDFRLPGMNGAEAVLALRQRLPRTCIVVVSATEDRREAAAALHSGATAFLPKASSVEDISEALVSVLDGRQLPAHRFPVWCAFPPSVLPGQLSERQLEILGLLCQGLSNKEIGLRLGLAVVTVKMHLSAIFRALGVINRTQAVLAARRMGMASPEPDPQKR